ncbi:MAG TPA: hypothetical protein VGI96_47450 [Streptosporangiaceae bacterium]
MADPRAIEFSRMRQPGQAESGRGGVPDDHDLDIGRSCAGHLADGR